jgi:Flp pilus assembly pilin Flp
MFDKINSLIVRAQILRNQNGQAAVEYALVIGLVSVAAVAGAVAMDSSLKGVFDSISSALDTVTVTIPS